ncbi:ATP synthase F1 subunit epsilon [bacterium]|nr:MAG: ATP synthase F1 subunit epsilon [bacterium]RIK62740.1 MAG: F0F1 ATP synthase subunit epsilon [Planctomycetota bacterium]
MAEMIVDVISPEKPLYSGKATAVTARAWDGELGIKPGHAPMLTRLGTGEVRIQSGGETMRFAVQSGFLEVADNHVVILSEKAVAVEESQWVKAADIEAVIKQLAETTDVARREELEQTLSWMRACEKLQAHVKK